MNVIKRNGEKESVALSKIETRIKRLKYIDGIDDKPIKVDHTPISVKVVQGLYDGVTTTELDNLAAETAAGLISINPEYSKIASRIVVSSLHKETSDSFSEKMDYLNKNGNISNEFNEYVQKNKKRLNSLINYDKDYLIDFFGIKTLIKSYLLKDTNGIIVERPQDLMLRVASFIHRDDFKSVVRAYSDMSNKIFTHATPTLFNAGTTRPQLSSCFLLDVQDDSISGIYKTVSDCAEISQHAGGIGLSIHKIRSKGSRIRGTGGTSNGIVPMLKVFNETARYVDQGGGKRKGSFAIYLEPWHADIFEFLDLKKNHGKEELRARDLFYAMWIPDLFMQRVEEDGEWTLFDPNTTGKIKESGVSESDATALYDLYGEAFKRRYEFLESLKVGVKTVRARDLWYKILESQIETGTPYMLYKDAINEKSNQKNIGTIKSSNLCTEIVEFTDESETAVCNLASISLSSFVSGDSFSFSGLYDTARLVCRGLNRVIDINHYPTKETKTSNLKHRPIGIGVQGLADVFAKLKIPFDGKEAKELNKKIFETIYKGAIDESCELAKTDGSYESYKGSPISNGQFQFDLWEIHRDNLFHDWSDTFKNVSSYGLRNSLLLAPMPTASTSQILGNNEAFEPFTSNIYTRRTLSGEFVLVNKYLVRELSDLNLWSEDLKNKIILNDGSIQSIDIIPDDIKSRFKTVWEISMKDVIDMAADRGAFIDQSQSMNLWQENPTFESLSSMHFYAWKKGLKTGMYYLRTKPKTSAIKGLAINENKQIKKIEEVEAIVCNLDDPDCLVCGS